VYIGVALCQPSEPSYKKTRDLLWCLHLHQAFARSLRAVLFCHARIKHTDESAFNGMPLHTRALDGTYGLIGVGNMKLGIGKDFRQKTPPSLNPL